MRTALMQAFGVPTLREAFNGPSKFVVDGVVDVTPPGHTQKRCVKDVYPAGYGVTCLCDACKGEDEGFDFD